VFDDGALLVEGKNDGGQVTHALLVEDR